jgi:F420 biosynthesis protein FbiB-like protein
MSRETGRFHELLQERRSVRRFQSKPVPEEIVRRLLQAGTRAPSAHNRQPWRFVILEDAKARQRLASAMGARLREDRLSDGDDPNLVEEDVARSYKRISEAPLAILLCLTMEDMDRYPDQERALAERVMAIQGVAMAGGFIQLATHVEGLGACWLCAPLFAPVAAREALDLPEAWEPQGLILVGYPARAGRERSRLPVKQVSLWR